MIQNRMPRGGRVPGAKNKKHKEPRKTIAVRVTKAELATLSKIHKSASKAIHALIAEKAKAYSRSTASTD